MARLRTAAALAMAGMALSACVTPAPCRPGLDQLAALECHAQNGDPDAQYALAVRLETGDGVAPDPARAARLYRQAGAFHPGTTYIWVPGAGKSPGYVMPVVKGPDRAGLAGAQFRLAMMYLEGRGVAADPRRAKALLRQAAKAGSAQAAEVLKRPALAD